ncbi:MAG TPA: A/G-specific adenine glycosylase [Bacteroidota bacterium]|jgi:A/G-specific adenine glycosylase|nr:A/G-specific adenine glycosylase [Bacteroidota bacterium]
MIALAPGKVNELHTGILRWYGRHRRDLQWRSTTDPYEILVSEVMLQQTQVARVQEKLPLFLKIFPTMRALARSSNAGVIRAWQGMGYNNRAVRLRRLAQSVVNDHDAILPTDLNRLLSLPGVGPYTAYALSCFAFRRRVPVVDVNVRRVLSRLIWKMRNPAEVRDEKEIWTLADRLLPRRAYAWNQALMDLGATICIARKPLCSLCPVRASCGSSHLGGGVFSRGSSKPFRVPEPSYDGIPRRIWRGKIIQRLRTLKSGGSISLIDLGKSVKHGFRKTDRPWLLNLVQRLEQEGLLSIQTRSTNTMVSLSLE